MNSLFGDIDTLNVEENNDFISAIDDSRVNVEAQYCVDI